MTNIALNNLVKAAKAVARHEQAYRQCARTERWPITMPVGELFDLSDAVVAMEAAPAGATALGEVEREIIAFANKSAPHNHLQRGGDDVLRTYYAGFDLSALAAHLSAALRRPQAPASGEGPRWRHKKRGSTYTEVGRGKIQAEHWRDPDVDGDYDSQRVDMADVVIYRADKDGSLWCRPVPEFYDGRFEPLPAPSPSQPWSD